MPTLAASRWASANWGDTAGLGELSPRWVGASASRAWRALARQNGAALLPKNVARSLFAANAHGDEADKPHIPVMLEDVKRAMNTGPGEIVIDATFGAGGYTSALLQAGAKVIAIDRDPTAIAAGAALASQYEGQLFLNQGRFSDLDAIARSNGFDQVDGVVADIGVSSMQIDQAERGFSFQKDGPLDMRMELAGPSAADVVNTIGRSDLTRIIGILGEERQASRVSAEICARREKQPFETTGQLARCVEDVLGRKSKDRIHPATRTFQALRIYVNRELEELADALEAAERILKPGGRLVVVTFHSLEDRLVKRFLQDRAEQSGGSRHLPQAEMRALTFHQERRGAAKARDAESVENPRARSAKLRYAVRTDVAARTGDRSIFGLPKLAPLNAGSQS